MVNEELLKSVSRIKATSDGQDLINFLLTLSQNNYKAFKCAPAEFNDVHKGQALAVDGLIEVFETCDDKLRLAEAQRVASQNENYEENPY